MECVKNDPERLTGGKKQQGKVHIACCTAMHTMAGLKWLSLTFTSPDVSLEAIIEDTGLLLLNFCKIQTSGTEENSESIADIF